MSDEAARYRHRAKDAEEQLQAANDTITELRIHNAFIRHALPVVDDLDAAWKLADHTLVTVDDDGNVNGMRDMITAVVRNYPYLERQPDTTTFHPPGSGGTPNNVRRKPEANTSRAILERKYPALRNR